MQWDESRRDLFTLHPESNSIVSFDGYFNVNPLLVLFLLIYLLMKLSGCILEPISLVHVCDDEYGD